MCTSCMRPLRVFVLFFALFGLTFGPALPTVAQSSLPDLYEWTSPSVGAVYVFNRDDELFGEGSGFLLHDPVRPGLFATNVHVLEGGAYAVVQFGDGTLSAVKTVLFADEAADIMLVEIEMDGVETRGLPLAKGLPRIGEEVFAIGNPLGLSHSLHVGFVSQIRPVGDMDAIQLNLDVAPGNSGGPLLNMKGEVLGLITSRIQSHIASGMSFATILNESVMPSPDRLDVLNESLAAWDAKRRSVRAGELVSLGWDLHEAGDLDGALQAFYDAIDEDAAYARAWFGLGYTLSDLGRLLDSVDAYLRTVELDPTNSAAFNNLAVAYKDLGNYENAVKFYRQAISINPVNPLYHRNLGSVYLMLGRRDLAERAYEVLLSLPGSEDQARILRSLLNN